MELKLSTLINSEIALGTLNVTRGLPSVTAYRISKIIKAVSKELTEYDDQRKKLCEEYANKDEEGKPLIIDGAYDIPEDKLIVLNEDLSKLRDETVNIDVKKVTLENIDKAGLTPAQLETIEFMLDLGEE